jgi:SAM-dependent methyltransferase
MTMKPFGYVTEDVNCYYCGSDDSVPVLTGEDDLTGIPGQFPYVRCVSCGLVYQNPRVTIEDVKHFYTDRYIAHRKHQNWGLLTSLYDAAMETLDRKKVEIVGRYAKISAATKVMDVGCAVGTFLLMMRRQFGCSISGVDFLDTSYYPGFDAIDFHLGLFHETDLPLSHFDLITMWHFLEHDFDPRKSLRQARRCLSDSGYLVVEVPRMDSLTYRLFGSRWPGVQAPQHTVLYSKQHLLALVRDEGFEVVDYLAYGAFPAYFYIATGVAFQFLKGRGLALDQYIVPYFLGQLLLAPVLAFEKRLNLAMQTVILKKRPGT